MNEAPTSLTVERTAPQQMVLIGCLLLVVAMGGSFTWMILWAIPEVLSLPSNAGDALLQAFLFVGGPVFTGMGLLALWRAVPQMPRPRLADIGPGGLRVYVTANGRRVVPPRDLPWSDIAEIRHSKGSRGAAELSVFTRSGEHIRIDTRISTPRRAEVLEHMLSAAKSAGYDLKASTGFNLIANYRKWILARS